MHGVSLAFPYICLLLSLVTSDRIQAVGRITSTFAVMLCIVRPELVFAACGRAVAQVRPVESREYVAVRRRTNDRYARLWIVSVQVVE